MMSQKDIGFGIIGCGMIANWHAGAVDKIDNTYLAGVVDLNKSAADAFAAKYGVNAYDSVEALLSDDQIEVVCICTPSGLHASLAIKVSNSGKHVVVEKPMAITKEECKQIINACEINNTKMCVISQLRFSDAVKELKKAVDDNILGKLVMGDVYMKFFRSQEYYGKSSWKGTWKMDGGGALMNQGIHGIDLLQYIMGPVKSVFAHTRTLARNIEVEDTAAILLEYENGAVGVVQGTTSIYPGFNRRLEVNGEKGSIVLEEDTIASWDIEGQEMPESVVIGKTSIGAASDPADISIEGHVLQLKDMIDAIKNDRKPLVDQYEGKKPVEIILAAYESSKKGRRIDLKESR